MKTKNYLRLVVTSYVGVRFFNPLKLSESHLISKIVKENAKVEITLIECSLNAFKAIFGIIILLFTLNISVQSQTSYKNNVSLIYQPVDNSFGLRIESHNIYVSATKGNYDYQYFVKINNHIKCSLGYLIPFQYANVLLGVNYDFFGETKIYNTEFDTRVLKHFSLEFGTSYKIKRFSFAVATDLFKWEPSISLGFNF
jgi:hypothetical protein